MQQRAIAQQRHHRLQAELAVKVRAADVHAAAGQDVTGAIQLAASLGREAQQRKVRGATADIDNQHQRLALDLAFVVKRGGNRFKLEFNLAKPGAAGDVSQGVLCQLVGLGVVIDKKHRPAKHHLAELAPGAGFGAGFQGADK